MAAEKEMVHPVAEANEKSPFGSLTADEFYARHRVSHSTSSFLNPAGLRIFTQSWLPLPPTPLRALVLAIHGFTGESSWLLQLTAVHFASHGFAVAALDHQGHGFSDGLTAHIPNINPVLDDCMTMFDSFRALHPSTLPSFIYSESLGGAIALLLHLRHPTLFSGIVLNGAMCGISDKFKPPWPLEHLLSLAAALIPTWRVVPTRGSIPDVSFKVEWKRKLALASPRRTIARPRAATAQELIRVCKEVQGRFEEVTVPMLIVHGGEDVVCDPACVEDLYKRARSEDKTLKIYPGLWHQMVGEEEEDVEMVFGDVLKWLMDRAPVAEGGEEGGIA